MSVFVCLFVCLFVFLFVLVSFFSLFGVTGEGGFLSVHLNRGEGGLDFLSLSVHKSGVEAMDSLSDLI